ncbi:unnamed protein product, partial [Rotaria magnacalcarata]
CLTIPSLLFLTLIYHRETTSISPTSTTTTADSSFLKSSFQKNFYRKSLWNYSHARCMDDSIASYYIRLANNNNNNNNNNSYWLIYFDGGWFCYSKESCNLRRLYSPNLM